MLWLELKYVLPDSVGALCDREKLNWAKHKR
jgi:hypothetical protein